MTVRAGHASQTLRRTSEDAANIWFAEHDPEDVAFAYEMMSLQ